MGLGSVSDRRRAWRSLWMPLATSESVRQASAMKPRELLVLVLVAVGSVAACGTRFEATVDGVLLAECDSPIEPPKAPILAVRAEPTVPDEQLQFPAGQVQLAIDRAVPWARVETLMAILESRKIEPILLAGYTYRVRRFVLNDVLTGAPKFTITGDANGKFCVQTALLPNAYCVQGRPMAGRHIHRAFVRETVRDVVKKWDMKEAEVYVDPATHWADVVRIVDGARTCCGDNVKVLVRVAREAPLGADAESGNSAIQKAAEDEAARRAEAEGAGAQTGSGEGSGTAGAVPPR
jgi:hypothetical protein